MEEVPAESMRKLARMMEVNSVGPDKDGNVHYCRCRHLEEPEEELFAPPDGVVLEAARDLSKTLDQKLTAIASTEGTAEWLATGPESRGA